MTTAETAAFIAKLTATCTADLAAARAKLAEMDAPKSFSVMDGNPHTVALADGSMTVRIEGDTLRLDTVRGNLIGSQWWSPSSARQVKAAASTHPGASGGLVIVTRRELLKLRIAGIEAMLADLVAAAAPVYCATFERTDGRDPNCEGHAAADDTLCATCRGLEASYLRGLKDRE